MPDSVEDALVCACMCTLRAPARAQPTPREEESRKLAAQLLLPRMKRWLRAGAGASRKRVGAVVRLVAVQGGRAGRGCALQLMLSLLEHLRSADSGADSMRLSSARAARVELFSLWLSICTPGWVLGGASLDPSGHAHPSSPMHGAMRMRARHVRVRGETAVLVVCPRAAACGYHGQWPVNRDETWEALVAGWQRLRRCDYNRSQGGTAVIMAVI